MNKLKQHATFWLRVNLKINEWAYALALLAFIRHEDEPEWKQYLSKTVKSDFEKCLRYMIDNEEEIFKFEDEKE